MDKNLGPDDEDTALLRAPAEQDAVSMHGATRRAIRRSAEDRGHAARVDAAAEAMIERWGDVLHRLGTV